MNNQDLNNLRPGTEVTGTYVVRGKKLLPFRDGSGYFLALTLGDKTGQVEARVWERAREINSVCRAGDVVEVTGQVTEYNGIKQLNLSAVTRLAGDAVAPENFIPATGVAPGEVWEEWLNLTATIKNAYLKQLLSLMADDRTFMEAVFLCPAAMRNHHALLGGLWQHTRGVLKLAEGAAAAYPQVDRDLLVTGALLHDIGKIEEFRCRADIKYTDAGRLLGHIVLGIKLVDDYAARVPGFPDELRLKLLHMIASHHGQYEWQSPKRPKFLEAAILHQLDMIDAQVDMFTGAAAGREDAQDAWTGWVRGLDRYVYCR